MIYDCLWFCKLNDFFPNRSRVCSEIKIVHAGSLSVPGKPYSIPQPCFRYLHLKEETNHYLSYLGYLSIQWPAYNFGIWIGIWNLMCNFVCLLIMSVIGCVCVCIGSNSEKVNKSCLRLTFQHYFHPCGS